VVQSLGVGAHPFGGDGQSLGLGWIAGDDEGGFALAKGRDLGELAGQIAEGLALGLVEQFEVEGDRVRAASGSKGSRNTFGLLVDALHDLEHVGE
jgi:hypothetical protein